VLSYDGVRIFSSDGLRLKGGFLMNSVMLLAVIGVLTVVCDVWRKDFVHS